jgi:hypothetical protein
VRRGLGTALTTLLLAGTVVGCGGGDESDTSQVPAADPTSAAPSSPAATSFEVPRPGEQVGAQVSARPADEETAEGAAAFAAWTLSLLLHTPREKSSTQEWTQAAGAACDACRKAAGVWQDQVSQGQVFRYVEPARFVRTVVRAQRQGAGWFVEYEAAVPRSTLTKGNHVLQSAAAEHLDYTFSLSWVDGGWRLEDFHVLG